jgi:D-alanyl-D-alanine carboxypeptidase (penicillin-binding protein 5/6)
VIRRLAVLATLLLAPVLAACGTLSNASTRPAPQSHPLSTALQAANGPIAGVPGRRPLELSVPASGPPVHVRFKHAPRSGLLFDLDTGRVLWERDPTRLLPIASVTKMMTALLVVEHESAHARVLITRQALAYHGSGVGVLPRGKHVQLETMLYGLLLPSGNDAAIALAQRVSGTVGAFVALMNQRAAELGLTCTHFSSPSGFVDRGNRSCAADLASLSKAVLAQPRLARIVRARKAIRPLAIKGGRVYLYSHNPLVQMGYPGTLGIKTGFTDAAGRCLVAAARRNGRRLGVVLLHSPNPGRQATQLLDRGFRTLP